MDLCERMDAWTKISPQHTINSESTEEAYWIYFMKGDVKMRYVKTVAGGMYWNYPEELMNLQRKSSIT